LLDPATNGLKTEHQAALNSVLVNLWQGVFAKPYHHAGQDNHLLRDKANA